MYKCLIRYNWIYIVVEQCKDMMNNITILILSKILVRILLDTLQYSVYIIVYIYYNLMIHGRDI